MLIHKLGENVHGLAIAALIAGAFAVSSAYAGTLQSEAVPGGCIGGYYCGGFTSFLRAAFPEPVQLSSVQFAVIAIPTTPVGRVYVDLYANGQRIVAGLDITGDNHFVSVPLPAINTLDLTIVPTTFDQIQIGTVTVIFDACVAGVSPVNPYNPTYPPSTYPTYPTQPIPSGGTNPNPSTGGTVAPTYPGTTTANEQTVHCASTPGQTSQCSTGFTQVTNVQISGATSGTTTNATCQYGTNWGISGNMLWVSNGCEGDFIIQGSQGSQGS